MARVQREGMGHVIRRSGPRLTSQYRQGESTARDAATPSNQARHGRSTMTTRTAGHTSDPHTRSVTTQQADDERTSEPDLTRASHPHPGAPNAPTQPDRR